MRLPETLPAAVARRVLLTRQGLAPWKDSGPSATSPRFRRSTPREVASLIESLGYVQIDSINVVDRAHHLILGTRLEGFRPAHLQSALEEHRALFEHWTHDACAIPIRWYPHWSHRFERYKRKDRAHAWWQARFGREPARVLSRVLARVRAEGALRARDFQPPDRRRSEPGGWWNWHPEKAALEHLWRSGRLAVAGRQRFEKVYDLPERVVPAEHAESKSSAAEHLEWACRSALERLGIATEREIAHFWAAVPLEEARRWVRAAIKRGELDEVLVERADGGPATRCVVTAGWQAAPEFRASPAEADRIMVLAPFDPVIRDRARLERLFGFEYRFEAFTPAARRIYGYYTMPLLEGDRFVGRIDPKFDRRAGVLEIRGPWWEPGIRADRARRQRLHAAFDRLAAQLGAASWNLVPMA
ncbi:MAG: YcaQ family DNA glycosylase [Phycisphaeraceae bacterium]|nr:YcaQ family DNA glycosylase [Phycisphaeraceae bacterium]